MTTKCKKCNFAYLDTHYSDYFFCEHEWESRVNFSQALDCIKNGLCMKREGWNGKDQFVFLVHGSQFEVNREPLNTIFEMGTKVTYRPHIDMKYQDGSVGVWLASMGDIMADDWVSCEKWQA